ncbi:MAG: hypothetical protein BM563_03060 [Bacteroidetes bacterium MedPE-SWsnd-G1]|nr:MAG: hypothetical protein BM563_03060 [Bacteroidetes bacterium MedPE-SWsnd-G1]
MQFIKDIFHLFFHEVCHSCQEVLHQHEKLICIACRHDFPETDFLNQKNNQLEKQFYGRVQIKEAMALFHYTKKGKVQHLIHKLKYKGQEDIGVFFGEWLGNSLKSSDRFQFIDCIVPVPIHPKKEKQRGYNQLTKLGRTAGETLNLPFIENNLVRVINTAAQTHKGRVDRFLGKRNHFEIIDKDLFEGKHILLLDDVITTGATIEVCTRELLKCKNVTVSVAVIAYTT